MAEVTPTMPSTSRNSWLCPSEQIHFQKRCAWARKCSIHSRRCCMIKVCRRTLAMKEGLQRLWLLQSTPQTVQTLLHRHQELKQHLNSHQNSSQHVRMS